MYAWHGYAITKFSLAKLLETGHCVGFKTKKLASKKYEVRGRLLECFACYPGSKLWDNSTLSFTLLFTTLQNDLCNLVLPKIINCQVVCMIIELIIWYVTRMSLLREN